MSAPQPSRVWRAILGRVVHADDRRFAIDDLADGFERRCAESGESAARGWYRQQVLRSIVPALGNRWSRRPRLLSALVQDLPYALRSLAKTPCGHRGGRDLARGRNRRDHGRLLGRQRVPAASAQRGHFRTGTTRDDLHQRQRWWGLRPQLGAGHPGRARVGRRLRGRGHASPRHRRGGGIGLGT